MTTVTPETPPTLNVDLLTEILKWAGKEHVGMTDYFAKKGLPEWEQAYWAREVRNGVCKTSCCLAGAAVSESGYVLVIEREHNANANWSDPNDIWADYCAPAIPDGTDKDGKPKYTYNPDQMVRIERTAQEVLGIDLQEAEALFEGDNNLADVVFFSKAIALRHGLTLQLPDALEAAVATMDRRASVGYGDTPEEAVENNLRFLGDDDDKEPW